MTTRQAARGGVRKRHGWPWSWAWHPGRWAVGSVGLVALLFLVLPIVALMVRAAQTQAWGGLLSRAVVDAVVLSAASTSITVALAALLGTPLAYILARWHFPFRRLMSVLVELPIVLPPAVAGLALLLTFGRRGLLGPTLGALGISLSFTFWAVVLAQTFVAAPFFIRAAHVGFEAVPQDVEEAARVDGAAGWALFQHITLPMAGRALGAGLVLCWARALGEFGATILFAGSLQGRTQTMPLLIYGIIERDLNAAMTTGLLLVGLALVALLVSQVLTPRWADQSR